MKNEAEFYDAKGSGLEFDANVGEKLYPLFLKVENQSCLVVGGGEIAHQKARGLLESGAFVEAIAPSFCDKMYSLAEKFPETKFTKRTFQKDDCRHRRSFFRQLLTPSSTLKSSQLQKNRARWLT
ncbi:MAG: NAD(P)-dependent oxidoreductase [Deltaproteobacteria bacterium]|nr:NAD(P)-dependent oxidoreductase [Deltaproteobacteria bacterium]